uniref:Predicted gene, 36864 n=1 Tax=Mus musculus TaxID=10090 RepID=A0A1Y7VL87_MOUSE
MDQNSSDLQSKETAAPSSRQNEMQDSLKVTLSLLDATQDLLDIAWACILISGVMSFCVFMGLISTIFFPSTNLPLMDFSLFICSLLTGFFSYLNYINFWSILSLQPTWS